ncbi:MAG: hypothetical protein KDC27_00575 [Acidobacteria bacterium]|nr:hypothetical protein [Acidobacteriota bacterium]
MIRILSVAAVLFALVAGSPAQTLDPLWNGPERMSSLDGSVRDRSITIDSRDRSHLFWVEDRLFEGVLQLRYVRFGGKTFTHSVAVEDFQNAFAGSLSAVDAVIDSQDVIHLIWHGKPGAIMYRQVVVDRALSPSAWSEAVRIPVQAEQSKLMVDVNGALVIVFVATPGGKYGLYSVRSTDSGATWSSPVAIDGAVPSGWDIHSMDADYDGSSAIHAAWTYVSPNGYQVRTIKRARSTDGGLSWSAPAIVDEVSPTNPDSIRLAVPEVVAHGAEAHIIYAGGHASGVGRRHLVSRDSGATWTGPLEVLGNLEGAAGTDSAYFDSHGRMHLFAQIRFPQGVYEAVYENGAWDEPQLIYLIAEDPEDVIGARVHAQWLESTVSSQDKVVLLIESCAAGCQDNSTWPQNPIMFAMNSVGAETPGALTSVSSATFQGGVPLAPGQIAAAFGAGLADGVAVASVTPRPTTLDGVSVEVADDLSVVRPAQLHFVSPGQINYVIPEETALGVARIRVYRNDRVVAAGTVELDRISPSIFTANGQGTGTAAGTWLFVAKDGARSSGLTFDPASGAPVAIPFDPDAGELYVTFYGTGLKGFQRYSRARLGNRIAPVYSLTAQGEFDGLDQLNVGPLPKELAADAELDVTITVDDVVANRCVIRIRRP